MSAPIYINKKALVKTSSGKKVIRVIAIKPHSNSWLIFSACGLIILESEIIRLVS